MKNHTAKHFVLQLGSLVSLYLSLSFLLVLLFGLINLLFPDAVDSVWDIESASSSVRIGIAMVVVFFPTYLALTHWVNKTRRLASDGSYLGLTKWLIYLSLLVGGAVLLGDLVAVIMGFLEGELTQRFFLKAASVLLVVGAAFGYYIFDAKGYWLQREGKSVSFGLIAALIVVVIVVIGFSNIALPSEVREQKLDETQLSDLQDIQWRIQDYLALNNELPNTLDDLTNGKIPAAPEGRPAYRYELTDKGFALCATFAQAATDDKSYYGWTLPAMSPADKTKVITNPDNWQHDVGETCFQRVVSK